MKKKGTTESYSALIGIIIAFLMLTAIGCAVYNIYKPKGSDSFNKLVNKIKALEKAGNEEGEYPLFLEEDWFVVGFRKGSTAFEHKPDCFSFFNIDCIEFGCPGAQGADVWGCYGFGFLQRPEVEGLPTKISKPKNKCTGDKSCLCLCKIEELNQGPFLISEQACLGSDAVCASFDSIDFVGSEECCNGVFIPGKNIESLIQIRGLKAVKYKKSGDDISLIDLTKTFLQKVIEKEKQKIVNLREYLKTRKNAYFLPVNWGSGSEVFERAVDAHLSYTEERIKKYSNTIGSDILPFNLVKDFNVLILKDYTCKDIDLSKREDISIFSKKFIGCLKKADPKITDEKLKGAVTIGLIDKEVCVAGFTDSVDTIVSYYKNPITTAHEWGHLMSFCDEYDYSAWKQGDKNNEEIGLSCMNPYPLCCKDHPLWEGSPEDYKKYLEKEKIGPNCYPHFQELSEKAKAHFKTKEEYEKYIDQHTLCQGHVCTPENSNKKYCRGLMGTEITCQNIDLVYDNSLEYSYLDFDRREDFYAQDLSEESEES